MQVQVTFLNEKECAERKLSQTMLTEVPDELVGYENIKFYLEQKFALQVLTWRLTFGKC